MEIGLLGLDGFQGSGNGLGSVFADGEASKQKWASRNEGFKQERFGFCGDDDCRVSKLARTGADFSPDSSFFMPQNSGGFVEKSTSTASAVSSDADKLRFFCPSIPENSALPYFHHMADAHTKNAGYYYSGGLSASSGMYLVSGVRGPFTASQWLELEQQALIYKYMRENEPIPLHLLFPIVKAFQSAGLFGFSGGTFRPTSWGMGPFHLGYSTSTDPEPGRCRRTDGKKWRCSKEAVGSQKYCERHMNRGRHRSRKHVEGQANGNGSSASGADNSSTTKLMPPSPSNNSFDINQNQNQCQRNAFVDRTVGGGEKSEQQASWRGSSGPCELMGAADFMSPAHLDMGLGLGSYGPLGEALQSSTG